MTTSMFLGVVVNSSNAPLSITEIRPIDTSRPLTRLFRVNRNIVWSATSPATAASATANTTATGNGNIARSVKYQVA